METKTGGARILHFLEHKERGQAYVFAVPGHGHDFSVPRLPPPLTPRPSPFCALPPAATVGWCVPGLPPGRATVLRK